MPDSLVTVLLIVAAVIVGLLLLAMAVSVYRLENREMDNFRRGGGPDA